MYIFGNLDQYFAFIDSRLSLPLTKWNVINNCGLLIDFEMVVYFTPKMGWSTGMLRDHLSRSRLNFTSE